MCDTIVIITFKENNSALNCILKGRIYIQLLSWYTHELCGRCIFDFSFSNNHQKSVLFPH